MKKLFQIEQTAKLLTITAKAKEASTKSVDLDAVYIPNEHHRCGDKQNRDNNYEANHRISKSDADKSACYLSQTFKHLPSP